MRFGRFEPLGKTCDIYFCYSSFILSRLFVWPVCAEDRFLYRNQDNALCMYNYSANSNSSELLLDNTTFVSTAHFKLYRHLLLRAQVCWPLYLNAKFCFGV